MNKFLGKNTPSIRESNMELLRVLCMLFIVCGHITLAHKFDLMGDSSYYINYFFRSFAVCGCKCLCAYFWILWY